MQWNNCNDLEETSTVGTSRAGYRIQEFGSKRSDTVWFPLQYSENTWELWRLEKSIKTLGLRQRLHLQVMPLLQTVDLLESWHQHHMQTNGLRSSDSHIRLDKSISYSLLFFHDYAACPVIPNVPMTSLAGWNSCLIQLLRHWLRIWWLFEPVTTSPSNLIPWLVDRNPSLNLNILTTGWYIHEHE